ncbi:MAG: hypothetical protein IKX02_01405, partial [Spirochaetales bacterium]|nr:hypothetical protein [Spirochaetales bacterium]
YADGYRSNTMFITDRQGKIKAIIRNGSFDFYPTLDEEVPYRVVRMNTERGAYFEKNEQLKLQYNPNINVDKSFVFVRADRPTKIEIQ